jgi:rhomboid family GlyGly-CTERM serine protease
LSDDSTKTPTVKPKRHLGPAWWLFGLGVLTMVLLACGGNTVEWALRYDRLLVTQGQAWRWLTAHGVHHGWSHLIPNVLGVGLVAALFTRIYSWREWCVVVGLTIVAIDIGFWYREPQLLWYVGASGVLHGVLAAGAIAWWRTEPRWLAVLLNAIFIGKLAWEQWRGPLPLSGGLSVIINAHLYGAVGGWLGGLLLEAKRRYVRRAANAHL